MNDERSDRQDQQTRSLEALDVAQRTTPFCITCGAPMVPVARGNELWLECPTATAGVPPIRRRLRGVLGPAHTRRAVLDHAA